ncbi:testis-specific gene A8 protein [Scaptodrosophila lebanonensis]|uniref:Testis-specific gene A8 protein n=1 Tax=Drosophila lebanonensis TaxID=7225 RepID=A0A6J2UBT6_DROLE|nr:testis-specific gene A8 protein [Scaptodrosophila lebanonensis]
MELSSLVLAIFASVLCQSLAQADVGVALQQRRRLQQQQYLQQQQQPQQRQQQAAYPAAGYRPSRQFRLPAQNLEPKPARLTANSEAQEDIDDAAEEVEVRKAVPAAAPAAIAPVAPVAPVQPTIAYYPAGAVGFVQPTAFAKFIAAPGAAAAPAAYVAPAAATAAYTQPQYYAAYSAPIFG